MKHLKFFLDLLLSLSLILVFPIHSFASDIQVPYPLSAGTVSVTDDPRENILSIAQSQLGYAGVRDDSGSKYSYFAQWCGTCPSNWCSEFASWCGWMAGMPENLFPQCTCVDDFLKYFGSMGQIYDLAEGNSMGRQWIGSYYTKTITLSEVQPGDIILIRRNSNASVTAPHHTCIVSSVDTADAVISTCNGNIGGTAGKVVNSAYKASTVYAVVKPLYELSPLSGISAVTTGSGAVKLSWDKREGVDGYRIYRSLCSGSSDEDGYALTAEIPSDETLTYTDDTAAAGDVYCYKIVPYKVTPSGDVYDGMSFSCSACRSDTGKTAASGCSHRYLAAETDKGSCVRKNTVVYTCLYCKDSYSKHERYGSHDYRKSILKKASASAPGSYIYKCSLCGASYTLSYNASRFTAGGLKFHTFSNTRAEVTGAASKKTLKNLTIPETVKFNGRTYKVTRIASGAFKNCRRLKTVTIKAALTDIKSYAFYRCRKLRSVRITQSKVPSIGRNAFSKISSGAVLRVPKAVFRSFKSALGSSLPKRLRIVKY